MYYLWHLYFLFSAVKDMSKNCEHIEPHLWYVHMLIGLNSPVFYYFVGKKQIIYFINDQ